MEFLRRMGLAHAFFAPDAGATVPADDPEPASSAPDAGEDKGGPKPGGTDAAKPSVPGWMNMLPDDLKTDADLARYDSIGSYVKAMKARDAEGPKDDGKDKPEPVKYDGNFAAKLDDVDDPFGNIGGLLKGEMEKRGIPQKDAEALVKAIGAEMEKKRSMLQSDDGRRWRDGTLAKLWGDHAAERTADARRAFAALGDADGSLRKALDSTNTSVNPVFWEAMSRLGSLLRDDGAAYSGETGGRSRQRDPYRPVEYPR